MGQIIKAAVDAIDCTRIIKQGFEATGLYPFNKHAVNYNVLDKQSKKRKRQDEEHQLVDQIALIPRLEQEPK